MASRILKVLVFWCILPLTYLVVPAILEQDEPDALKEGDTYTVAQQLFRQGYWAFQQHEYADAIAAWRRFIAEESDRALLDYAYLYLGRSLLYGGYPKEAGTLFETFSQTFPNSLHTADLAFLIADSYYIQGDYATALQQYLHISTANAYKKHPWLPKIFVKIGYCYEQQAWFADAWKIYHQARLQFVAHPVYSQLKSCEEALFSAHPEASEGYGTQTQLKDVDTLLKYGRAEDALEILNRISAQELSASLQSQILLKYGQIFYTLRDNEQALVSFEEFLQKYPKSKTVPYVLDRIARLHLRRQDLAAFQSIYDRLKKQYPQSGYTAGVMRLRGKELQLLGNYEDALKEFDLFLKWYPKSSLVPEILWYIGWTQYLSENPADALKTFNRLVRSYPKSRYRQEALYWSGRAAEQVESLDEAIAAYYKTREVAPRSYYGILSGEALTRLQQQYPDVLIPEPTSFSDLQIFEQEPIFTTEQGRLHYQMSRQLYDLQFYDLAANEFAYAIDRDKTDQAKYLELARLYALAGKYHRQVKIMQGQFWKWIVEGDDSVPDEFWRLAYPLSFAPIVTRATTENALDPLYVYALMFAESVFDQEAYSPAGARGLMQLMPATGARMAASAGMSSLEPAHYFSPDINITLGTTYLKQLLHLFDGHLPPVIASYNAGEAIVSAWWKPEYQHDAAVFIANIPYRETKNYVQKVFWYFWEYQRIYRKP